MAAQHLPISDWSILGAKIRGYILSWSKGQTRAISGLVPATSVRGTRAQQAWSSYRQGIIAGYVGLIFAGATR